MSAMIFLWMLVIGVCFAGVFILSLAEASLLSVSPADMRRAARRGDRAAQLVIEITDRADFLSVVIVGVNTLVLIISNRMTHLVHHFYGEDAAVAQSVAHIAMLVSILAIAELWPKTYGSLRSEMSARAVAGVMSKLIWVLTPMVMLMTWISNAVMRIFGISPRHHRHFVTAEEIMAAADLGEEEGTVEPEEGEMLDSVIELRERTVKDIMVPRVDMVALSADATVEQLMEVAVESGFSRIPIYAESIDHITGIVYVNDILMQLADAPRHIRLAAVARTPILAPESKRLDEMLSELRQQKVHIAIVIDEFGGTEGLVTIEDILEELVGEIEDEHDLPEPEILVTGAGEALIQGKARIEDLNAELGTEISTEAHDTVSGFLTGMAGRVPQEGEVLTAGEVTFVVVESNDQHVDRLRVIAPTPQEAE
ncbi:MAG: hemolysin family protein [Armatimonadota bacterium]|nr:hemolysin family protein [Armatimonadota bacterium]